MGAGVGIVQGQKLIDEGVRLRRGHGVVALDRRFAGHGGHPAADRLRVRGAGILGELVDHLHEQIFLGDGEQVVRHAADGVLPPAEGLDLKADPGEILPVFFQKQPLPLAQGENDGGTDGLGGELPVL